MLSQTTVKDLRGALERHFDATETLTLLKRLRAAELLPAGTPGYGGVGSARIGPREAALVLLAVAASSWCDPIDYPAEVRRLADFELRQPGSEAVLLIDVLAGELSAIAGDVANHTPSDWRVGSVLIIRESEPRLRFIAPGTPLGVMLISRETTLAASLLVEVAELCRASQPAAAAAAAELERA